MQNRKQEIIGILLLIISLCILASLVGFHPSEEPRISPKVKLTNTMGIVGIYVSYGLIKLGFGYSVIILPLLGLDWQPGLVAFRSWCVIPWGRTDSSRILTSAPCCEVVKLFGDFLGSPHLVTVPPKSSGCVSVVENLTL